MKIVYYGDPILRQKARQVARITPEVRDLIDTMAETLREAQGLGLAAPQVGANVRVVVYDIGEGLQVLINPTISNRSGEEVLEEGCLSLPNLHGEVARASSLTVKARDRQGKSIARQAVGLEARVIQHECDHLDGKLFVDRVREGTLYWALGEGENGEPLRHPTTLEAALRVFESRSSRSGT